MGDSLSSTREKMRQSKIKKIKKRDSERLKNNSCHCLHLKTTNSLLLLTLKNYYLSFINKRTTTTQTQTTDSNTNYCFCTIKLPFPLFSLFFFHSQCTQTSIPPSLCFFHTTTRHFVYPNGSQHPNCSPLCILTY